MLRGGGERAEGPGGRLPWVTGGTAQYFEAVFAGN